MVEFFGETADEKKEQEFRERLAKIPQSEKVKTCKAIILSGKVSGTPWMQADTYMSQLCLQKDSAAYDIWIECLDATKAKWNAKLRDMFGWKSLGMDKKIRNACRKAAFEVTKAEWNDLKKGLIISKVTRMAEARKKLGTVTGSSPWLTLAVLGVIAIGGIATYYTVQGE